MLKNQNAYRSLIVMCLGLLHFTQFCSEKSDSDLKHGLDSKKSSPPRISTSPTVTITPANSASTTPRTSHIPHPLAKVGAGFSLQFSMKDIVPLKVTGNGDPKESITVEPTMSRDTAMRVSGVGAAISIVPYMVQGYLISFPVEYCAICAIIKPKETAETAQECHNSIKRYGQQTYAWCGATGLPWMKNKAKQCSAYVSNICAQCKTHISACADRVKQSCCSRTTMKRD